MKGEHDDAQIRTRVMHDFTLHPPATDEIARTMDDIRASFRTMALDLVDACPTSRERSTALTKLEEACFWAIASIARAESNTAPRPKIGDVRP